jgi:hypothetical protein
MHHQTPTSSSSHQISVNSWILECSSILSNPALDRDSHIRTPLWEGGTTIHLHHITLENTHKGLLTHHSACPKIHQRCHHCPWDGVNPMYSHLLWDKTNQGLVNETTRQWTSMNLPPPNRTRHAKHAAGTLGGKDLNARLNMPTQQDHPNLKGLWDIATWPFVTQRTKVTTSTYRWEDLPHRVQGWKAACLAAYTSLEWFLRTGSKYLRCT